MCNALEYAFYYATGRTAGGVSGTHCLTLGFPDASKIDETVIADFIAFDQNIDVTGVDYIQFWIKGECHSDFGMEVLLDGGIEQAFVVGEPYIARNVFTPVAVNVSGIVGVHNLKFRLRRLA